MVTKCYNTCFALENEGGVLLVDAGGGNRILAQLEAAGIQTERIHHMIVTHEHCDHILGVVWMVRKIGTMIKNGKYEGEFRIYCHAGLIEPIKAMCGFTLQKKFTNLFDDKILLVPVDDGECQQMLGYAVTFFDIHSTKAKQYGFTLPLHSGKVLTCMGDEPYNPLCERYIKNSDWLLSEAFCLYEDRDRFKPYEKHHSTVKDACELATQLGVANLVLWHTEDKNYERRKELYTAEGRAYYKGNLLVPYDLEVISL
ncbi:MAG: MBL fold metallo-hydrolase [Anaerotruncus sp.]|nr:MBL fold metallo-hydrolase [Anaerotruncus sp.]